MYIGFSLDIPIDSTQRDEAIRTFVESVMTEARSSGDPATRDLTAAFSSTMPDALARVFRQHRAGQFDVECFVRYQGRVVSVGHAKLEVRFDGEFFDQEAFRNE